MILVTTPTGQIGSQLVNRLLGVDAPVRVIVRDPTRLDPKVRERVEVTQGSHDDPGVLDQAMTGADSLFWLVPPNSRATSAHDHYLTFATAGAAAIRRHAVGHVVSITSAGHNWTKPAGLLSAAFAMDAELERSGTAYRALSMPFYMDNLDRNLDTIRDQGVFAGGYDPTRPLAMVATRDIAQAAAELLTDLSWTGQQCVPVFGPDRLNPTQMAEIMAEVLDRPVAYQQTSHGEFATSMAARGMSQQAIQDMTEMHHAQNEGLYDADWAIASPTATDFRTWFSDAVQAHGGIS